MSSSSGISSDEYSDYEGQDDDHRNVPDIWDSNVRNLLACLDRGESNRVIVNEHPPPADEISHDDPECDAQSALRKPKKDHWFYELEDAYGEPKVDGGSSSRHEKPAWWHKMHHAAMHGTTISDEEKNLLIERFPTNDEMFDNRCWYSRAVRDNLELHAPLCHLCGFQNHSSQQCPSPFKWRLEKEGELHILNKK
ncbi:unnamed protein product [Urochloa humidicola]